MRRVAEFTNPEHAARLADFLLTRGIDTRVDPTGGVPDPDGPDPDEPGVDSPGADDPEPGDAGAELWVIEEDRVDEARAEVETFLAEPDAPRYRTAAAEAGKLRDRRVKQAARAVKAERSARDLWDRPFYRRFPVTTALIAASVLAAACGLDPREPLNFWGRTEPVLEWLYIAPWLAQGRMIYWDGLAAVESGQVWRLVTPIFLHADLLHIGFNVYVLMLFGRLVEAGLGWWRFLLTVLTLAVLSNLGEYWANLGVGDGPFFEWRSSPLFGGMSGVNYGLFGLVLVRGKFDRRWADLLPQSTVVILLVWFFACVFGVVSGVANVAHAAGLLAGAALGALPALGKRPD